jgi:hypothetical protein
MLRLNLGLPVGSTRGRGTKPKEGVWGNLRSWFPQGLQQQHPTGLRHYPTELRHFFEFLFLFFALTDSLKR